MSDEFRPKPKSLLEAHRDANTLIQALNEFAASQQKPSTSPDLPESSSQDQAQDPAPSASTSANQHPIPKTRKTVKGSGQPVMRQKPAFSEQPSVSKLLELGVKVRDFAYESTLPPVPTVYLQPRQIQPSVPKDVNDPNDPHYVLEEERKKKVYTFESTRKIQRTPTEPVLESELLPPPPRTFPKIKRSDAMLDLGTQFDSQPQSQPMPSYPALPYDITNIPQSASQPVPELTTDSQETEPWVGTPVVTPNGSLQWPEKPKATTSTAPSSSTGTQPKVALPSASPSVTTEMNLIATTDSQTPPEPETLSYSQIGFAHSEPQALVLDGSADGVEALISISESRDYRSQPNLATIQGSSQATARTDSRHVAPRVDGTPLVSTSPIEFSVQNSPRIARSASPGRSATPPVAGPSKLSLPPSPEHSTPTSSDPSSTTMTTSPHYNLRRNKNKRRAESPPPTSPGVHPSSRQRLTRSKAVLSPIPVVGKPTGVVSMNSVHLQDKAIEGVISTGRTMKKRTRDSVDDAKAVESISAAGGETRRSKRRNKSS